jgi:hypothetical protein
VHEHLPLNTSTPRRSLQEKEPAVAISFLKCRQNQKKKTASSTRQTRKVEFLFFVAPSWWSSWGYSRRRLGGACRCEVDGAYEGALSGVWGTYLLLSSSYLTTSATAYRVKMRHLYRSSHRHFALPSPVSSEHSQSTLFQKIPDHTRPHAWPPHKSVSYPSSSLLSHSAKTGGKGFQQRANASNGDGVSLKENLQA